LDDSRRFIFGRKTPIFRRKSQDDSLISLKSKHLELNNQNNYVFTKQILKDGKTQLDITLGNLNIK
jgi:hypothetical protein